MTEKPRRSFTATIKEGGVGDPVSIHLELAEGLGIPDLDEGRSVLSFTFPAGTPFEDVKKLHSALNSYPVRLHVRKY